MTAPPRSWLYTPATRPDRVEKALAGPADVVIADLEDGVAADRKEEARAALVALLRAGPARALHVRVNHPDTPEGAADVAAVALPPVTGVRVPKVSAPAEVRRVAAWLDAAGSDAGVHCLLETALGVERAYEIASASPRVATISLGEADLAADLGVTGDAGFAYARGRVVVAARAAGLPAPAMGVWTDLADLDGLRCDTVAGRALGFFGRSVVHPSQVPVVNEVFTPDADEVAAARTLVAQMAAAEARGDGAFALPDGRMVDKAVVEVAHRTLALAGADR